MMAWRLFLGLLFVSTQLFASNLLVIGDSISAGHGINLNQGWVALLQNKLDQSCPGDKVVNASIGGDTTNNGLARLPSDLKRYQPSVILIELGGNDGLRGLSLQAMQKNLSDMVALAKKSGAKVVLLGIRIPPNYGPLYTKKFHAIYPELAKKYAVSLVPMLLKDVGGNPNLMQADGVHPNAKAQPVILSNVWPVLQPLLSCK